MLILMLMLTSTQKKPPTNQPTDQPTNSHPTLLKLHPLPLLLPPSSLSASPPAVVGESTNIRPRTSISATISARTTDRVIPTAHGTTAREITPVDREFRRRQGQVGAPKGAIGHFRRRRDIGEGLGVGRADARAGAAVAAGAAWGCVGLEAA
jgi:hypothetical protein